MIAFDNGKTRVGIYPTSDGANLVIGWDSMNVPLDMTAEEAQKLITTLTKALEQAGHLSNK